MLETIKQDIEELSEIRVQLISENIEKIDFDSLVQHLQKIHLLYENYIKINNEHQQLQESLVKKIRIMEKAILAVTRKRQNITENDLELQELLKLNSQQLLQHFDKTESRFHAAFPSTFRLAKQNKNNYKDYKSYR